MKKVKTTFREGQTKLQNKDAFKLHILTMSDKWQGPIELYTKLN